MQVRHVGGPLVQEARQQDVPEQVVIAVPLPPVIERNEEQVASIEPLERGVAARWPVTASTSGPVMRARIDVSSRKLRTCSGWRRRTSSMR